MSVVLINGSAHKNGCTFRSLSEIAKTLNENGIQTEFFQLGSKPIAGCIWCNQCAQTGFCQKYKHDKVNEFIELLHKKNYDGFIFGSPVHYASASGFITAFMDRLFYSQLSANKPYLDGKLAAGIVNCRRAGSTATFEQMNKYFMMTNMPVVSSQYWNETHGSTPKDVEQDLENLQTMRTLGRNMAWLIKCIKFGEEKGVVYPGNAEPIIRTNFIR